MIRAFVKADSNVRRSGLAVTAFCAAAAGLMQRLPRTRWRWLRTHWRCSLRCPHGCLPVQAQHRMRLWRPVFDMLSRRPRRSGSARPMKRSAAPCATFFIPHRCAGLRPIANFGLPHPIPPSPPPPICVESGQCVFGQLEPTSGTLVAWALQFEA